MRSSRSALAYRLLHRNLRSGQLAFVHGEHEGARRVVGEHADDIGGGSGRRNLGQGLLHLHMNIGLARALVLFGQGDIDGIRSRRDHLYARQLHLYFIAGCVLLLGDDRLPNLIGCLLVARRTGIPVLQHVFAVAKRERIGRVVLNRFAGYFLRAGRRRNRNVGGQRGLGGYAGQELIPPIIASMVAAVFGLAVIGELLLRSSVALSQMVGARDVPQSILIDGIRFQVRQRQPVHVFQIVGIYLNRLLQEGLRGRIVFGLKGGEPGGSSEDLLHLGLQFVEVSIGHAFRLLRRGQPVQPSFRQLPDLGKIFRRFRLVLLDERYNRQSANVVGIFFQDLVRDILHFGLIAGLLVTAHRLLQSIHLHDAGRILVDKRLHGCGFRRRIGRVQGGHVGVVLGRILDHLLAGRLLIRRGLTRRLRGITLRERHAA